MENIAVTVIVPIYNEEKYLTECLDSLERQTFTSFEVILVNDGSTDASGLIAAEYAKRNRNFKLLDRKNGGLSAARNTGLEDALGEYVCFLDSDDYYADDAIEKLYKKAKKDNLDQLRFGAYEFEDGSRDYKFFEDDCNNNYRYRGNYSGVYNGIDFYRISFENGDYIPSVCLMFIKRRVIEANKLKFYEGIIHEDNLFGFLLTNVCQRVSVLNEPLYYGRIRQGSITNSPNWMERNRSISIIVNETDKFYDNNSEAMKQTSVMQMSYYFNTMLDNWGKMTYEERESSESKEYFSKIRPVADKYLNGGTASLKLFYSAHSLYIAYSFFRHIVSKMHNKN